MDKLRLKQKHGVDSEKLFREMTIEQLLSASKLDTNDEHILSFALGLRNQSFYELPGSNESFPFTSL